jgi:hypothetical protein
VGGAIGLITLVVKNRKRGIQRTAGGVKCHLAGKATYGDRIAVRARLASLGLVMTLGFLLLVSLVVSTALSAIGPWLDGIFPGVQLLIRGVSFIVSLGLIALLFAVIYKVLPDSSLAWRDVIAGRWRLPFFLRSANS